MDALKSCHGDLQLLSLGLRIPAGMLHAPAGGLDAYNAACRMTTLKNQMAG
jgi:hypothetical protein